MPIENFFLLARLFSFKQAATEKFRQIVGEFIPKRQSGKFLSSGQSFLVGDPIRRNNGMTEYLKI